VSTRRHHGDHRICFPSHKQSKAALLQLARQQTTTNSNVKTTLLLLLLLSYVTYGFLPSVFPTIHVPQAGQKCTSETSELCTVDELQVLSRETQDLANVLLQKAEQRRFNKQDAANIDTTCVTKVMEGCYETHCWRTTRATV